MAKVERNALLQGISGALGRSIVFRQMRDGSTIISSKPDFSNRKFSKGQLIHQSRFQQAVAYAREAARTNSIYAQLSKGTPKTAYNVALSDWFNPPVIRNIKRQDGIIRVEATDNVLVAKVQVSILDAEEKVLEQGQALLGKGIWWEYVPAMEGKVIVEAWDLAGNAARKEM
jgi:hypothetical protein